MNMNHTKIYGINFASITSDSPKQMTYERDLAFYREVEVFGKPRKSPPLNFVPPERSSFLSPLKLILWFGGTFYASQLIQAYRELSPEQRKNASLADLQLRVFGPKVENKGKKQTISDKVDWNKKRSFENQRESDVHLVKDVVVNAKRVSEIQEEDKEEKREEKINEETEGKGNEGEGEEGEEEGNEEEDNNVESNRDDDDKWKNYFIEDEELPPNFEEAMKEIISAFSLEKLYLEYDLRRSRMKDNFSYHIGEIPLAIVYPGES